MNPRRYAVAFFCSSLSAKVYIRSQEGYDACDGYNDHELDEGESGVGSSGHILKNICKINGYAL